MNLWFFVWLGTAIILGGVILLTFFERKQLLNRIMSKNYQEYEYFTRMFGDEVKEMKRLREEAREKEEIDRKKFELAQRLAEKEGLNLEMALSGFEEPIDKGEVDMVELQKKLSKGERG